MAALTTYLAPGQRYAPPDAPCWSVGAQVTVLHVYKGVDGFQRIAFRCPKGKINVRLATEIEEAVEAGQLVPVVEVRRLRQN